MSENAKKGALIGVIVLALCGAVFGAMRLFGGEKMEIQNTVKMPAGYKSEKERALEQQKQGSPGVPGKAEVDLGGPMGG